MPTATNVYGNFWEVLLDDNRTSIGVFMPPGSGSADAIAAITITSPLATLRLDGLVRMRAMLESFAAGYIGDYPDTERLTWTKQEAAARAHLAGTATTAQTAMLTARTEVTGETLTEFANKVVANADAFAPLGHWLSGLRSAYEALISNAVSGAAIETHIAALAADLAAGP